MSNVKQKIKKYGIWFAIVFILILMLVMAVAFASGGTETYTNKKYVYDTVVDTATGVNKQLTGEDYLDADYRFTKNSSGEVFVSIIARNVGIKEKEYESIYANLEEITLAYEKAFKEKGLYLTSFSVIKNIEGGTKEYSISFDELLEDGNKVYSHSTKR